MNEDDDKEGLLARMFGAWNRVRENPAADVALGFTPAGVAADIQDAAEAVRARDALGLMLAGAGFIPGVGDVVKGAGKAFRKAEDVSTRWAKEGVDSSISEGDNYIRLHSIVVPESQRNTGIGTAFMNDLNKYADAVQKPLLLTPDPSLGGSSKSRLENFYKRFGFGSHRGRNRDYSLPNESMIRPPGL